MQTITARSRGAEDKVVAASPDAHAIAADLGGRIESKEARLQRHRLRMTLLSFVNSLLQSGIVMLFAMSGATTFFVATIFAGVSIATSGLFVVAVASKGLPGAPDAHLLREQLAVNFAIQMAFLGIAPSLWIIFLASTLVTFSYAMVGFTPRQFNGLWLGYGLTTAIAMIAARDRLAVLPATGFNFAIIWLFFFLCIRRMTLTGAQFSRLRAQLSEKNRQLTTLLLRNEELAHHDELTGAINRRRLMQLLTLERERFLRTGLSFSVAIFDIDHFKKVNDTFGHSGGDAVLKHFCGLADKAKRAVDQFARYGGEEFVLLMPDTASPAAASVPVERIRRETMAMDWGVVLPAATQGVTVSAGIATCRPDESAEDLLARADAALYLAKNQGRNRSVVAAGDIEPADGPAGSRISVT